MAPKSRKTKRQIYDYILNHGCQIKIYSCKIRLTTVNFEPWSNGIPYHHSRWWASMTIWNACWLRALSTMPPNMDATHRDAVNTATWHSFIQVRRWTKHWTHSNAGNSVKSGQKHGCRANRSYCCKHRLTVRANTSCLGNPSNSIYSISWRQSRDLADMIRNNTLW